MPKIQTTNSQLDVHTKMNAHILSIFKQEKYVEMLVPQSLLLNTFEIKQIISTSCCFHGNNTFHILESPFQSKAACTYIHKAQQQTHTLYSQ